jgi:ankyrin repeat protein
MKDNESIDDWIKREQLHFAAQDGDLVKIEQLLQEGYDINAFDDVAYTPLHYAVNKERFEAVRLLLERGANVNANLEEQIGNTPLRNVAEHCSLRMAKLLLDAGADPAIPSWMRLTALHQAEDREDEEGKRVYALLLKASKKPPSGGSL